MWTWNKLELFKVPRISEQKAAHLKGLLFYFICIFAEPGVFHAGSYPVYNTVTLLKVPVTEIISGEDMAKPTVLGASVPKFGCSRSIIKVQLARFRAGICFNYAQATSIQSALICNMAAEAL